MPIAQTACPYDCPDCCGLLVTVEDGRAVKTAGDPTHPFTRGTLCPKMAHYERTVHHPGRLTTPLRRTGAKGAGEFTPISWDEAIKTITDKFRAVGEQYGYEAIMPYSYAGTMGAVQHNGYHAFFYKLGASNLARTICAPAKGAGYKSVMGASMPTAPQEAQQSDLIVLWSLSLLATDIHFQHDVEIARQNGAKIWCIDTYATRTAEHLADETLYVKPGTDGALALGVLHILARDGLTDINFIARHVQGWHELQAQVLPRYTPEYVSAITGLNTAQIEAFAHAYGQARAPFIRLGSGLSRYTNGSMTVRLITCLPAAVGAYAHAGGGLLTSVSSSHAIDRELVYHTDWRQPGTRTLNMCELGRLLNDKTLAPPVKVLYIYSSNPAATAPDQNAVLRGLTRTDLFTVVHERFLTDTARYADIVLPATSSLEADDIYPSYGNYCLQRGMAIIPPVGESKSNWQVACLLAQDMGWDEPFFQQTDSDLVEQLIASTAHCWPDLPVGTAVPTRQQSQQAASLRIDPSQLRCGIPTPLALPANYKMQFRTPSRHIEILNPAMEPALPDYFPPTGDAAPFHFVNSPDARVLDSSFNERAELTHGHTMELLMHPADAQPLHLQDGQRVTVSNARGEAQFKLSLSERTPRGTVVTEGVWSHTVAGGLNTNALTSQRLTDKAGGSTFYDVNVDVRATE